ncbi:MAG: polyprenyl synthetase family protein [Candidatus Omnitrophica bacterium]|nr:polyprenyl synthetase family protein [Candidatus Omnitrophota bacterium]
MFLKIKNRVERELSLFIRELNRNYSLSKLSPVLFSNIKEFISRKGKRIRPILFCIGYRGFSKNTPPGLYRSALSLELLHDFMLVHDDIIDKSDMRRGGPSMHVLLNKYIQRAKNLKFKGDDLAIVTGDVMYAMALDAFLAIREKPERKELALKKLISAALHTGSGEFIELLLGTKPIEKISKKDIYKIYAYKTANYTFASPLAMGAILAGAKETQVKKLFGYGMLLGRSFQIKDDIIGTFGERKKTGKSNLTDINEAKRTLLIWHAYNHCDRKSKAAIKKVFSGKRAGKKELLKIRRLLSATGSLDYARREIKNLLLKSERIIQSLKMRKECRAALVKFSRQILSV